MEFFFKRLTVPVLDLSKCNKKTHIFLALLSIGYSLRGLKTPGFAHSEELVYILKVCLL